MGLIEPLGLMQPCRQAAYMCHEELVQAQHELHLCFFIVDRAIGFLP